MDMDSFFSSWLVSEDPFDFCIGQYFFGRLIVSQLALHIPFLLHQGPQQAYFLAAYAGWQLSDLPRKYSQQFHAFLKER